MLQHIRKKRLLESLNESPGLNERVLHQQDACDEPAIVLASFDENQFKEGNESIKVLEVHANQEIHMNFNYEKDFSHEQQGNLAAIEDNKIQNPNEIFSIDEEEESPNKGMPLSQEYRRLDGTPLDMLRKIDEEKKKLTQLHMDGQQHFVNPEMQLTNPLKSQINTINEENEIINTMIGNTNNNASVHNQLETIHNVASYLLEKYQTVSSNGGNESCQELPTDNEMHLTNSHNSEITTTKDEYDIAIEGMENIMITDTETFASFHNPLPTNEDVTAHLKETFQMICCNANDKVSRSAGRPPIDKDGLEKFKRYVERLENVVRIKARNLMTTVGAATHLLNFAEKLEQQEEIEDEQNFVVQESEDKKDFKLPYTNDNKYDIPHTYNQNEYLRQSPEYQEQHRTDNSNYNDLNNFQLQSNKGKNLPYSPVRPEEQINIMKTPFEMPKIQLENPQMENISITPTSSAEYPSQMHIENRFEADENGMVCIGPNGTMIPIRTLESIDWSMKGSAVTRQILVEIFGRKTLAVHNLTGKPSPAFIGCNKPVKSQLDPIIVADIIHLMGEQKGLTSKEVRNAITTKCADENKMLRLKEKKRQSITARNMISGPYF